MRKAIYDKDGDLVYSDMDDICQECVVQLCSSGDKNKKCPLDGSSNRLECAENKHGKIIACSSGSKTRRNFKAEFETLQIGMSYYINIKHQIVRKTVEEEKNRVTRLEHNIRTLNAQCMMLLEKIVPQHLLLKNMSSHEVVSTVQEIIANNPRDTAVRSLKLAKHLLSVKSEMFVYEIALQDNPKLQREAHKLRDVLMLVLYKFFGELYDKNVFVDVDEYYEYGYFDFDTVNVAFYYIVENASKYVCPNTRIKVHINKRSDEHVLSFEMRSLHLGKDEEGKIFHKGYSGKLAKVENLAGEGFGMYQAKRLLEMNDASIDFVAGEETIIVEGIGYSDNIINVEIPVARDSDG